jgi:hypothetical protein
MRLEDEEQWLDVSRTSFAKGKSALKPYPDELMDAHDVSPIVNSAKKKHTRKSLRFSEFLIIFCVSCIRRRDVSGLSSTRSQRRAK